MKKLISIALVVCMCLATCAILASCEHEHSPSNAWEKDSTYHWHVCASSGCGEALEKTEHEYKIEQGDKDRHKKVCECGDTIWLDHKFDDGEVTVEPTSEQRTGETVYTCRDCGYVKKVETKYQPDTEVSASEFRTALDFDAIDNYIIKIVCDNEFRGHSMYNDTYEFLDGVVRRPVGSGNYWYWSVEGGTAYQYYYNGKSYVKKSEEDTAFRASMYFQCAENIVSFFNYGDFRYNEEYGYYEMMGGKTRFFSDVAGEQGTYVDNFDSTRLFFEDGQLVKIMFTRDNNGFAITFKYGEADFTLPEVE